MSALESRDSHNELRTRWATEFVPRILEWCRRWGLQDSDAHDVTQDVWIKVDKHLVDHGMELPPYFEGTLKKIAANTAVDHRRKRAAEASAERG